MIHPCDKLCGNKTASGYCATTSCINPQYSNIGTVQYGQGVQKRIITNADRIRSMTDEELAEYLTPVKCVDCHLLDCGIGEIGDNRTCEDRILSWLKREADGDNH